jgi:hypothetical protein
LLSELFKRGYTEEEIKKVAGQNLLRVLRAAEQIAAYLNGLNSVRARANRNLKFPAIRQ